MIQPSASFKENLSQLPSIENVERLDLYDRAGVLVAQIENQPGKQGSLAVYNHLAQTFGDLTVDAAKYAVALFGEHSQDAQARPGAHPNIDRLFEIIETNAVLKLSVIAKAA